MWVFTQGSDLTGGTTEPMGYWGALSEYLTILVG